MEIITGAVKREQGQPGAENLHSGICAWALGNKCLYRDGYKRKMKTRFGIKLIVVMIAMTVFFTIVWQCVIAENLYDCTDSVPLDFLRPGDWVHDRGPGSIVQVDHIVHGRPMGEPDTVRKPWTLFKLLVLWSACNGVSVYASIMLARRKWFHRTAEQSHKFH